MNVFARELRAGVKEFAIWAVVTVFFLYAGTVKFTGVESAGAQMMEDVIEAFPRIVLAMFGMADIDIMSFPGYFAVLEFYIALIAGIYAARLGAAAVSRELADKTYEFLFVRPVSRTRVLAAKLAAAVVLLALLCAVNFASAAVSYAALGLADDMTAQMARYTIFIGLVSMVFLSLGAAASAAFARCENGERAGYAAVIAAYLAGLVYDMLGGDAELARFISPFKFFLPSDVLTGHFDAAFLIWAIALVAAGLAIAFARFSAKDLAE